MPWGCVLIPSARRFHVIKHMSILWFFWLKFYSISDGSHQTKKLYWGKKKKSRLFIYLVFSSRNWAVSELVGEVLELVMPKQKSDKCAEGSCHEEFWFICGILLTHHSIWCFGEREHQALWRLSLHGPSLFKVQNRHHALSASGLLIDLSSVFHLAAINVFTW